MTYGTNNEFGFDYLRDNMKFDLKDYVQRELNFAIVDEVDSILIDEARTPLIISGPAEESTDKYYKINRIIPSLKKDTDYTIEEKTKTVALTEEGNIKVERLIGAGNLYDPSNVDLVAPRAPGAEGARPVPPRRGLRGQGRRGPDRGRVHGQAHAGQALERRPAPGDRGEGKRQDRE